MVSLRPEFPGICQQRFPQLVKVELAGGNLLSIAISPMLTVIILSHGIRVR
jgi:hypothetical protein